jgi:Spy/CpxP family protein refolding chaperone
MKKLFALALVAAISASTPLWVSANMEDMSVDEKMQKLDSKLDLTDEQEAQIRPLIQQKKDGTLSKEEAHTQIREVLTSEQQTKYDEMKAEKEQKSGSGSDSGSQQQ